MAAVIPLVVSLKDDRISFPGVFAGRAFPCIVLNVYVCIQQLPKATSTIRFSSLINYFSRRTDFLCINLLCSIVMPTPGHVVMQQA